MSVIAMMKVMEARVSHLLSDRHHFVTVITSIPGLAYD
jgi:hypothetical protein